MKFLFWQFGIYAVAAFALGFGAAWSWFHERVRGLETSLERTRTRAAESLDTRSQLREARNAEREATETAVMLKARLHESELGRSAADVEVESLRATRLKLLAELSELRSHLDRVAVSSTRLNASENETLRVRGQLVSVDEQLRTERAAREQTMALLQGRLLAAETELAANRLAGKLVTVSLPTSRELDAARTFVGGSTASRQSKDGDSPELIVDLREPTDSVRHHTGSSNSVDVNSVDANSVDANAGLTNAGSLDEYSTIDISAIDLNHSDSGHSGLNGQIAHAGHAVQAVDIEVASNRGADV